MRSQRRLETWLCPDALKQYRLAGRQPLAEADVQHTTGRCKRVITAAAGAAGVSGGCCARPHQRHRGERGARRGQLPAGPRHHGRLSGAAGGEPPPASLHRNHESCCSGRTTDTAGRDCPAAPATVQNVILACSRGGGCKIRNEAQFPVKSNVQSPSRSFRQGISNEVEAYFGVNKFQLGRLLRTRLQAKLRDASGARFAAKLQTLNPKP